jgi:glycosyltransferase involved in cell wall biosynthesis
MRIGLIAACPFPAHHGTPGGIREKAEALAALGHEVHVITYASCQQGEARGVITHRIPAIGPVDRIVVGPSTAKILWNILLVLKTISVVRGHRIEIIHGMNYEGALVGAIAKWATGRPLIYGAVNIMSDELPTYNFIRPVRLARLVARLLDRFVPRLADHVVCYTPTIRDVLVRLGVPQERLEVVKLGIDLSLFAGAERDGVRARMGVNGEPLIVYTGVLNKFQRIDYLLQAMRVVLREMPQAKLAFVRTLNDEPQRWEVERQARRAGVGHVVLFPEVIGFSELPSYIAAADATAIPRPDCPGVPVKLLNFMAVGKPVVVTRGSSQGLRDGAEVLVTEDHNAEAMGQALLKVLRDKDLAVRLGRNAQRLAFAEYDRSATAELLVDVYRRVLAGGSGAPLAAPRAAARPSGPIPSRAVFSRLPRPSRPARETVCLTGRN